MPARDAVEGGMRKEAAERTTKQSSNLTEALVQYGRLQVYDPNRLRVPSWSQAQAFAQINNPDKAKMFYTKATRFKHHGCNGSRRA